MVLFRYLWVGVYPFGLDLFGSRRQQASVCFAGHLLCDPAAWIFSAPRRDFLKEEPGRGSTNFKFLHVFFSVFFFKFSCWYFTTERCVFQLHSGSARLFFCRSAWLEKMALRWAEPAVLWVKRVNSEMEKLGRQRAPKRWFVAVFLKVLPEKNWTNPAKLQKDGCYWCATANPVRHCLKSWRWAWLQLGGQRIVSMMWDDSWILMAFSPGVNCATAQKYCRIFDLGVPSSTCRILPFCIEHSAAQRVTCSPQRFSGCLRELGLGHWARRRFFSFQAG